ncbi:hypothetical protein I3843_14G047200 [Carya illinoinensis]|nr:hypothetical protein I3843_14G047200 [Carya illinoinensis]
METNIFPLELLGNDNYVDWSVKMKNYLLGQGLWNLVETSSKPSKPDDDVVEFEAWRKRNDMTLQAIQSSCGMDILCQINNICSANISWEILAKMFMERQEREDDYAGLVKAVQSNDWETARDFLKLHPAASTARITFMGGTVLYVAVEAEQECIMEELVNMISEDALAMQDYAGDTALHRAITSGNHRMAECLITKNKSLVTVRNANGELPLTLAMAIGHKELARYLYSQFPFEDLEPEQGRDGARLLIRSIYNRDIDMALDLVERCPRLAFALDQRDIFPLRVLAISTEAFESENRLVFWKRWIYNHCIQISLDRAADQFRLHIQNYQEKTIGSGFKRLYEMKLVRAQFQQFLSRMCEAIPTTTSPKMQYDITVPLMKLAISRGNFEFVHQLVKSNSSLLWICDATTDTRKMFHCAVVYRQHRIFSLAYNLKKKNYLLNAVDKSTNNMMLHLAGTLPKYSPIDHIRGAALQMQREVQWFKEVERISPPSCNERLNNDGLIPRQLFTKEHQELRKDGEKWMKGTATSCTVVGALIITIMFAAAFTIPGGNKQDTGLPIFVYDKLFKLFYILMFLGILTSRYAEEDFLISLSKKMIIGLFALFFSIATMMIAFFAALLLMLIPIILFVLMQFHLLIDMLGSTYGSGIFDRKMKF